MVVLCLIMASDAKPSDLSSAVSEFSPSSSGLHVGIGALRVSKKGHYYPTISDTELLVTLEGNFRRPNLERRKLRVYRPFDLMCFNAFVSFKNSRPDRMKRNEFSIEGSLYEVGIGEIASHGKGQDSSIALGYRGGLSAGMDYYRSDFGTSGVTWDESLSETTPHLQYFVLKPVGGKALGRLGWHDSRTSFGVAVFPFFSANSSILLHDIEDECPPFDNPSFRSVCWTKQNYYYSFGGMVRMRVSFRFRRIFAIEFRNKIYFFRPLLVQEPVRDRVHYLRTRLRIFMISNMELNTGFELWSLGGRIERSHEDHVWGAVFATVAYRI